MGLDEQLVLGWHRATLWTCSPRSVGAHALERRGLHRLRVWLPPLGSHTLSLWSPRSSSPTATPPVGVWVVFGLAPDDIVDSFSQVGHSPRLGWGCGCGAA